MVPRTNWSCRFETSVTTSPSGCSRYIMARRLRRTGSSSSGRFNFAAITVNARSVTVLYVTVLRSMNWPSSSISIPSASHCPIRRV